MSHVVLIALGLLLAGASGRHPRNSRMARSIGLAALLLVLPVIAMQAQVCDAATLGREEYQPRSETDSFDGFSRMRSAPLSIGGGIGKATLTAQRFTDKSTKVSYHLIVDYEAEDWLFIRSGPTLRIKIGDSVVDFTTNGEPDRETMGGGRIRERALYDADLDRLAQLANASAPITVRIYGAKAYEEYHLVIAGRCAARRFLLAVDSSLVRPYSTKLIVPKPED